MRNSNNSDEEVRFKVNNTATRPNSYYNPYMLLLCVFRCGTSADLIQFQFFFIFVEEKLEFLNIIFLWFFFSTIYFVFFIHYAYKMLHTFEKNKKILSMMVTHKWLLWVVKDVTFSEKYELKCTRLVSVWVYTFTTERKKIIKILKLNFLKLHFVPSLKME